MKCKYCISFFKITNQFLIFSFIFLMNSQQFSSILGLHVHQHSLSRTNSDASVVFATSPFQQQHHHQQHQQQYPHQQQVRLESPLVHSLRVVGKPPSPSPSDRSLPPFSSGSSVSETSTGSGGSNVIGPGKIATLPAEDLNYQICRGLKI